VPELAEDKGTGFSTPRGKSLRLKPVAFVVLCGIAEAMPWYEPCELAPPIFRVLRGSVMSPFCRTGAGPKKRGRRSTLFPSC